jgi:hypothetical protein
MIKIEIAFAMNVFLLIHASLPQACAAIKTCAPFLQFPAHAWQIHYAPLEQRGRNGAES